MKPSRSAQQGGAALEGTAAAEPAERAAGAMPEVVSWSACELATAIRSKRVSCQEVMKAYLGHIERCNPRVNAIVSLRDDDELLDEAAWRDRQLARGEWLGWMHGFPHAVKDMALTNGIRTTCGSPLVDLVPEEDDIYVERLRNSGAIIIGKTNVPEFGLGSQTYNPVFGVTLNAYDPSKTAGGSSGGAAAALALRMLPVADGSDMMGSLRNPAAYNNVIGFRPSYGRVPSGPSPEVFLGQLSCAGPMARSVADAAKLLAVMAGADDRAPLSIEQGPEIFATPLERDCKGTGLGWLGDLGGYLPMEAGILELCRNALEAFEGIGCVVEEARLEFPPERLWHAWVTLRHWLIAGALGDFYRDPSKRARMKPEAQWEVEGGLKLAAMDVFQASAARSAWYQALRRLFEKYDFLVLPGAQVFPFDATIHWPGEINGIAMDSYHRWMEVMIPASMAGCPAISLPAGFDRHQRPMGIQLIGRHHADFALLQLACAYDQATGWVTRHLPPSLAGA
ncbi:MAG TPA: amidase [Candidatus Acidoferrales bacterium]|nr:amidase [Candidatus Acidoferrales bacterium]